MPKFRPILVFLALFFYKAGTPDFTMDFDTFKYGA